MNRTIRPFITLLASIVLLVSNELLAHPGSGIVVDRQGNVYFVDTGSGIWRIDPKGELTRLSGPAYHWMAIDHQGLLKNVTLPYFSSDDATVARVGENLLVSSDFPVTIGRDGSLYYPWHPDSERWQVFRLAPSGTTAVLKPLPAHIGRRSLRWVNGIASASDGSLYYTEDNAVRKISARGELTTVVENMTVTDCSSVPGVEPELKPYFRGLDVDSAGTVYVAAAGCGAVLKIKPEGTSAVVLRAQSPWSPTGIAVSGGNVYVLEYLHTANDNRREWIPRVRKLSPDGRVATLATINRR